ncbi:MAG: starch-binding protein [Oscillospiraceae bacterium]|nr:starch-binding protein [Oscillospiraceae bacterium]
MKKRTLAILVLLALVLAPAALAETVYYYNDQGWAEVTVYTWEPSEQWGSWPGGPTVDEGDGWFSIDVADYAVGNHIIFNNNNGGAQTSDLVLDEGKLYFYGSNTTGDGSLTAEEAVAKFGSAPGVEAPVEEAPAEEAPAESAPKTGDSELVFLAVGALVLAACAAAVIAKKVKA